VREGDARRRDREVWQVWRGGGGGGGGGGHFQRTTRANLEVIGCAESGLHDLVCLARSELGV
jgi:hypothetical protein